MGSRSFLYGTFANWVELFQLAKAFYMGYVYTGEPGKTERFCHYFGDESNTEIKSLLNSFQKVI